MPLMLARRWTLRNEFFISARPTGSREHLCSTDIKKDRRRAHNAVAFRRETLGASAALAAHARPPQEAVAITIDSARRRCPSLPYAQHRVANPKRLHQPDGRNAVAFRRETLGASAALAAHARPPQERRSPELQRYTVAA